MLGQQGKGEIDLECTEAAVPRYPDLLFGTDKESGQTFFDSTLYVSKIGSDKSIKAFFVQWRPQISALCDTFGIEPGRVCLINKQGHYLIDANFLCLFISYLEPSFLARMCDRVYDLLFYGVTVSDSFLTQLLQSRAMPEELMKLVGNGTSSD